MRNVLVNPYYIMQPTSTQITIKQGRYAHPAAIALVLLPLSVAIFSIMMVDEFFLFMLLIPIPFIIAIAAMLVIQSEFQADPESGRFRNAMFLRERCLGGRWKYLTEYRFGVLLKHKTKQSQFRSVGPASAIGTETTIKGEFSGIKLHHRKGGEPELLLAAPQETCIHLARTFLQPNDFTLYKGIPKAGRELRFKAVTERTN